MLDKELTILQVMSNLDKLWDERNILYFELRKTMDKFGVFLSDILTGTPLENTYDNPFELEYNEVYDDHGICGDQIHINYIWKDYYEGYDSHSEIRVPLGWLVRFDQGDDEDELSEEIIKHIENITLQKERDHLKYIKDEVIRLGLMEE